MKSDVREWLAAYPRVSRISTLAVDALACGLLDLDVALSRAVVLDLRLSTGRRRTEHCSLQYHQRAAYGFAKRRNKAEMRIEGGVAVLNGSIAAGIAVSQTRLAAVLHLDALLPETVVALLPGRALADVVDLAVLRRRNYVITTAEQRSHGLALSFAVPTICMPLQRLLRAAGSAIRSGNTG